MSLEKSLASEAPPASADTRRSPHALDMNAFAPAIITLLAQKITSTASALYRPRFGVGITDWRIIALLAGEPWLAPVRIAQATGLDKAAVSRSLRDMHAAGLVEAAGEEPQRRRRPVALTAKGLAVHDELVGIALARESQLLAAFQPKERATLIDFLGRLLLAVEAM